MLFSEVYGAYYDVLSRILAQAVDGTLTRQTMYAVIRARGFEESVLTIPQNLADQTWPLVREDLTTPLAHKPVAPLTMMEKRWMKALLADPRIRLFDPPAEGLEDVTPLYPADALVYFDRYLDGDPFEDPEYIRHFRTVLTGLREKRWMQVRFTGRNGTEHCWRFVPHRMEYSAKDDKFRVIMGSRRSVITINLARIRDCTLLEPCAPEDTSLKSPEQGTLILELTDERNALERCMLHFSHLEKETERLDENHYRLTLRYDMGDETEMLIRVLSFGPLLKVISPEHFRNKLHSRIEKQKKLRTQE